MSCHLCTCLPPPVPCIDFVCDGMDGNDIVPALKLAVPITSLNMITQLCGLLDALLVGDDTKLNDPQVSQGTEA